jgi:hypothetical protein
MQSPFSGKMGSWSLLLALAKIRAPLEVYGTPIVKAVVEAKWQSYGRALIFVDALNYVKFALINATYMVLVLLTVGGPRSCGVALMHSSAMGKAAFVMGTIMMCLIALGPVYLSWLAIW